MPNEYNYIDAPIPVKAGIGLRSEHYNDVLEQKPQVGWLEVHSENYFGDGGRALHVLKESREHYPISFHGVAMSLGSVEEPDKEHLKKLKNLIQRFNPALVSEHIAWSITEDVYLNDLLPLPYTEEALNVLARNVNIVQDYLGRQILVENPSAYLTFSVEGQMNEGSFVNELANKTGCGLLLDVNNVFVSCQNMKSDPIKHLADMPFEKVQEIHLAGHTVNTYNDHEILVDSHSDIVCDPVWALYEHVIAQAGPRATLIEWDTALPELSVLVEEARKADEILTGKKASQHAA